VTHATDAQSEDLRIAWEWCTKKGTDWAVVEQLGPGGTAFVFGISSPSGPRALKIYSAPFSTGEKGHVEAKRIEQQVALGRHDCKSLVQIYEGGSFKGRLFLLMSRAPGKELEKRLQEVPREKIRQIVDQVAQAVLFLSSKKLCHRDIKAANIFISDDFEQATLLDISVIRDIHDPIGIGTDHEGQLPVVATARYSPPEYLFRLIDPGPELWDALSVYQLGALLHDLIVQKPLFHNEYINSAGNRYRFAWIVASVVPEVIANDVDQDLIFLARRALEKNWERRLEISLEEFLSDAHIQQKHALEILGLSDLKKSIVRENESYHSLLSHATEVADALEKTVRQILKDRNITARHSISGKAPLTKVITFEWIDDRSRADRGLKVQLALQSSSYAPATRSFVTSVTLIAVIDNESRLATTNLPVVADAPGAELLLGEHVEAILGTLAARLMTKRD
jgi:serine/threonine protein kinase